MKPSRFSRFAWALLAVATSCVPPDSPPRPADAQLSALFAADSAFASDSRARGAAAWAAAWAESGRMQTGVGEDAVGPEAVRSAVAPMLEQLAPRFRWVPEDGGMLWPGRLGYTVGPWWIDSEAGDSAAEGGGRYLTVWTHEGDAWKAALDLSLAPCGVGAPGAGDFDFWVGDWTVSQQILQEDGSYEASLPRAHDTVTRLNGCTVVESWRGAVRFFWEGMTEARPIRGASVRTFDTDTGEWRIYGIDTLGGAFGAPFVGTFRDGTGEFFAPPLTEGGRERRIRFSRAGAAVLWELDLQGADGSWLPLWKMEFERAD